MKINFTKSITVLFFFCFAALLAAEEKIGGYGNLSNVTYRSDFYGAVNGQWMKDTAAAHPEYQIYGRYYEEDNAVDEGFIKAFETQQPADEYEQLVFNAYKSAFDLDTRNKNGIEPVKKYIEDFRAAATVQELIDADTRMFLETGVSVIFTMEQDWLYNTHADFYILPSPIAINFNNKEAVKILKQYVIFLASKLYGPDFDYISYASQLIDFEKQIRSIPMWWDGEESPYYSTIRNLILDKIDISTLFFQRQYTSVPFLEVNNKEGFAKRCELLFNSDLELLKKRSEIMILYNFSPYLTWELEEERWKIRAAFVKAEIPSQEFILQQDAVLELKANSTPIMEQIFVKYVFPKETAEKVNELGNKIKASYIKLIENSNELPERLKTQALGGVKIAAIVVRDTPHQLYYYEKVPAKNPDLYVDNINALNVASNKYWKRELELGYISNTDSSKLYDVNSYLGGVYEVNLHEGYIQPPHYYKNDTIEELYGAYGRVIAHELSHTFSYLFSAAFPNKEKFAQQLSKSKEPWGITVDGKVVLNEAIADVYGLKAALEALREEKENPDLELFFKAYARSFRELQLAWVEAGIRNDTTGHPGNKTRVNCIVSQFPEFYQTFNVKKGDKMYVKPEDRVSLW